MTNWLEFFLWTVFPYLALVSFFVGIFIRFKWFPFHITAKSSELMEKKQLMIGSLCFHVGIILVFFGHVAGIIIPKSWTDALGISNEVYHIFALMAGGVAGTLALIGMIVLSWRRVTNKRVRVMSSASDLIVNFSLLAEMFLGMASSFIAGPLNPAFNYRTSLAIWFRHLFIFQPDWTLMSQVPTLFKVHVFFGFLIFMFFPYTRLIHAIALPYQYIYRRFIVYRKRPRVN